MRASYVVIGSAIAGLMLAGCGEDDVDRSPGVGGAGAATPTGTSTGTGTGNGGTGGTGAGPSGGSSSFSCADPDPNWRMCEDFETGQGDFDTWMAASPFIGGSGTDDRGRVTLASDQHRSGSWAAYMPAAAAAGHQGGSLDWWDCVGAQDTNCSLNSHDTLYFRV